MVFLFYAFNISVIVHSWKRFHDYLNPIFAIFSIWTFLTGVYDFVSRNGHGYRILSNNYYIYVFVFLFLFSLLSFFILSDIKLKETTNNSYFNDNLNVSVKSVDSIVRFAIIANISYFAVLIIAARSVNPITIMYNIRQLTRGDDPTLLAKMIKIPALLFNFTPLILCYIFMFDIKAKKRNVLILMLEMFVLSFLLATKGRIIRFTLLFLIFLKHKLSKRKFIFALLFVLPLATYILFVLVTNRDAAFFDNYSLVDYLYVYFLAPIPSLDRLVCGELDYLTVGFGPRTLEYFYKLLNSFIGTSIPDYYDPGYIRIPSPNSRGFVTGNVFTGLGLYYLDYGIIGAILCSVFFSFVYTYVYKQMVKNHNTAFAIFYVINFPYLLFHCFGDLIIGSISITIQEFISALIIAYYYKHVRICVSDKKDIC